MATDLSSSPAYTHGLTSTLASKFGFTSGAQANLDNVPSFLSGNALVVDNTPAYLDGDQSLTSSVYAFLSGYVTSSTPGYMEGTQIPGGQQVAEYDYIWLKTDDGGATISAKFRVIAQGYDDGELEKAEDIKRTIGGGLDVSVGAVYKSWNPIIKVRASELVSQYGDLNDLVTLYNLNDPGGTPSNVIDFVDHHGATYQVYIVGTFRKSLMGARIEGSEAWSMVKIKLVEAV